MSTTTATSTGADEPGPIAQLAQRAHDILPESARPFAIRTTKRVTPMVQAVDTTLKTTEAQRLASTGYEFGIATIAFTLMLLAVVATCLESVLQIPTPASPTPPPRTQQSDQDQTSRSIDDDDVQPIEPPIEPQDVTHASKARFLLSRYATITSTAASVGMKLVMARTQGAQASLASRGWSPLSPTTGTGGGGVSKAGSAVSLAKACLAYALSYASRFDGPGSQYIQPLAVGIISKLPEDAKAAVRDSRYPFDEPSAPASTSTSD